MIRRVILAAGLMLGTACTTTVEGLYLSDAFTPSEIHSGSILTGGVVDSKESLSRQDANSYSALMLGKFKYERSYVKVEPVEILINALGDEKYDALMKKYNASGWDVKTLEALQQKLPQVRFVALTRIESNITEKISNKKAASESKDSKGNVTKKPEGLSQVQTRSILASMHIYDLKNKNLAFAGQVAKSLEARHDYQVDDFSKVMSILNAIKGKPEDSAYPFPDAPETRTVLAQIFTGFAENFPKE